MRPSIADQMDVPSSRSTAIDRIILTAADSSRDQATAASRPPRPWIPAITVARRWRQRMKPMPEPLPHERPLAAKVEAFVRLWHPASRHRHCTRRGDR